jgi:hypothetical protein
LNSSSDFFACRGAPELFELEAVELSGALDLRCLYEATGDDGGGRLDVTELSRHSGSF